MSEPTTAQTLAEEVTRLYYGAEQKLAHKVARAHLTGIIIRVIEPRIAELEGEVARALKIERLALAQVKETTELLDKQREEIGRLTAMVMNSQHALDEVGAGIARRVLEEREALLAMVISWRDAGWRDADVYVDDLIAAIRARPAP